MTQRYTLCHTADCCPEIVLADGEVRIGEDGNLCVLKPSEWAELKKLVLEGRV